VFVEVLLELLAEMAMSQSRRLDHHLQELMVDMSNPQSVKEGTFEWIVDWESISRFLEPEYTHLYGCPRSAQRVLVVGCGTSTISHCIAQMGFMQVVSVDNDAACIEHMRARHAADVASSASSSTMSWYTYDLIEHTGDEEFLALIAAGVGFDLIVDKGTLDAILVEGAISPLLVNIHRLLKNAPTKVGVDEGKEREGGGSGGGEGEGGVYVLCSINSEKLLISLLHSELLGLDVRGHDVCEEEDTGGDEAPAKGEEEATVFAATHTHTHAFTHEEERRKARRPFHFGTVVICQKTSQSPLAINEKALAQHEQAVMDEFFKNDEPLLTKEYEDAVSLFLCTQEQKLCVCVCVCCLTFPLIYVLFSSSNLPNKTQVRLRFEAFFKSLRAEGSSAQGGGGRIEESLQGRVPLRRAHTLLFDEDEDGLAYNYGA